MTCNWASLLFSKKPSAKAKLCRIETPKIAAASAAS
jgi:hypothetical protein